MAVGVELAVEEGFGAGVFEVIGFIVASGVGVGVGVEVGVAEAEASSLIISAWKPLSEVGCG